MTTKRKPISPRRRRENARKAALVRWRARPQAAAQDTLCKAQASGSRMVCIGCGLAWSMDDANYPVCPNLAGLKALPAVSELEGRARAIVHALCHGGHRADFDDALVNRPDWQAHVDFIVGELVKTCAEVA